MKAVLGRQLSTQGGDHKRSDLTEGAGSMEAVGGDGVVLIKGDDGKTKAVVKLGERDYIILEDDK